MKELVAKITDPEFGDRMVALTLAFCAGFLFCMLAFGL